MTEGNRTSYHVRKPTGEDFRVVVCNAGGTSTPFSRPGTSAVVYCADPLTGHDFAVSANELGVLSAKRQGIAEAAISEQFGWRRVKTVADSLFRLQRRLQRLGWGEELLDRQTMIATAERLGLLDPRLLNTVTRIIHDAPAAQRTRRSKKKEGQME